MAGKSRRCEICGIRESFRGGFFASFPVDEARCKIWVKQVGKEDLVHVPIEKLHDSRHICVDHFEKRDFGKSGNKLKKRAFPKLHLAAPPLSDHQMMAFPQHVASKNGKSKSSTEYPTTEARLQKGETHIDHTYSYIITNKPLTSTLPVGNGELHSTTRQYEKLDTEDTQIDAAPVIEPVPEPPEETDTFYEDIPTAPSPDLVPEVEDSGGETLFSWQRTELIEADEPEAPPAPAIDPTLSLLVDFDSEPEPEPQPDQAVPSKPGPEDEAVENRCKDCGELNAGFEFWCVQCSGGALCGACAGRPPHHAHYVLRAPVGATQSGTRAVLAAIRQQLQNENLLSQHETVDDGMKVEVKDEPVEIPPTEPDPPADPNAEPDPLACESRSPLESHVSEPSSPLEPHSPFESNISEPHSPLESHSLSEPHSPQNPATHDVEFSAVKSVDHHEPFKMPRLRQTTDHGQKENLTLATQPKLVQVSPAQLISVSLPDKRKLVKVSPAQVKSAFLSHIERIVTTQQKQLKLSQPPIEHTSQTFKENVVTTEHSKVRGTPIHGGKFPGSTQHNPVKSLQPPTKVIEPTPSDTVTIDLDDVVDEETVEYLEEEFDSDIETIDENLLDDNEVDVLDEEYLVDEDSLIEDDLSVEDRAVDVAGRGVKRKYAAEETLPMKGPHESMIRALPTKGNEKFLMTTIAENFKKYTHRQRLAQKLVAI